MRRTMLTHVALCSVLVACTGGGGGRSNVDPENWTLVEDLRIGSIDDPETTFTSIGSAEIGPEGSIYIAQPQDRQIRIFDAQGVPDTIIGGQGQGPGEFRFISNLGFLGDTLYVVDAGLRRISYFSRAHELLNTQNLSATAGRQSPSVLLADGTALSLVQRPGAEFGAWLRVERDGTTRDTLVRFPMEPPVSMRTGSGFITINVATPDMLLGVTSPDGRFAYIIERHFPEDAEDAMFRVTRITVDANTAWSREHHFVPEPAPRSEYDSILSSFKARNPAMADAMEQAMPYRPFRVPITQALVANDGTVWLRREEAPGAIEVRWDVLNPEGDIVASTILPASTRILAVHDDAVYAAVTDEFDVPYLVRYRISADSSR